MKLSEIRRRAYDVLSIGGLIAITVGLVVFTSEMTAAAKSSGIAAISSPLMPSRDCRSVHVAVAGPAGTEAREPL